MERKLMGGAKMAVAYDPTKQYEIKTWDVAYRHDPARTLLARIYQPQGDGPFPALLDVHGGAWNDQDRTANALVDERLAASGILVESEHPTAGRLREAEAGIARGPRVDATRADN